jgi:hypothetical protein
MEDQQAAGALMWTCITFAYLVPAAILTMRLLAMQAGTAQSEVHLKNVSQTDPQSVEVV